MVKDIAASVKQRLLNVSRERREDYNFVLRQYVLQRLMYRLGVSAFADDFLLKGGLLFWVWNESFHRPTQDMDLLGFGSDDIALLKDKFLSVIQIESDDGLVFDPQKLEAIDIKEDAKYQGVRITGRATLVKADIPYQIDIGFGDAVVAVESTTEIPVFLDDLPAPKLKVYPVESVIAEKFHAMVVLGLLNSRMKDFFDIVTLAEMMHLESKVLQLAIQATFERRDTAITGDPLTIFTDGFMSSADKEKQWRAFVSKNRLDGTASFSETVNKIQLLLEPLYQQIVENIVDDRQWSSETWSWS